MGRGGMMKRLLCIAIFLGAFAAVSVAVAGL